MRNRVRTVAVVVMVAGLLVAASATTGAWASWNYKSAPADPPPTGN